MGSCCSCFRVRAAWDVAPAEIQRLIQREANILYDDPIVITPSSHAPAFSEGHESILGDATAQYFGTNTFCSDLRGLSPPEIDYKMPMITRWVKDCGVYARKLNKIEVYCYSEAQQERADEGAVQGSCGFGEDGREGRNLRFGEGVMRVSRSHSDEACYRAGRAPCNVPSPPLRAPSSISQEISSQTIAKEKM